MFYFTPYTIFTQFIFWQILLIYFIPFLSTNLDIYKPLKHLLSKIPPERKIVRNKE